MRNIRILYLLLITSFIFFSTSNVTFATFNRNASNPVLNVGSFGWDDTLVTDPFVLLENGNYTMWYGGHSGVRWSIGKANSLNGVTWTKYVNNPIITFTSGESAQEHHTHTPVVVKDGGIYKLWYTSSPDDLSNFRIGYATSPDGVFFTKYPVSVLFPTQPWENQGLANPYVLKINNTYHMWYSGFSSGVWRIGYATSTDGVSWIKYSGNPILTGNALEGSGIGAPTIQYDGQQYTMYYHGGPGGSPKMFFKALSIDGINWSRYENNPILTTGQNGSFDDFLITVPRVIRDKNKHKMWYGGHDGTRWRIGLAEEKVPVQYFAQDDPMWGGDIYDSADKWANLNSQTMASLGCAVTSAAMVLKNLNVQKTPGNPDVSPNPLPAKNLDPGTLNEWLKSRNDGAFRNGSTNWALIANMTKLSNALDPTSPKLEYFASPSASLNEVIGKELPAILNLAYPPSPSNAHFVVATEVDGATYKINDPFYEDRTTLVPHYNTINRIGYYQPTNSNFSYLILVADPEVTLTLKNGVGQVIGEEVLELPIFDQVHQQPSGATALKILTVKSPDGGDYTLELSSLVNLPYKLDIYFYDQGGNGGLNSYTGAVGPTAPNHWLLKLDAENTANTTYVNVTHILSLFDVLLTNIQELYDKHEISQKGVYNSLLKKATNAKTNVQEYDFAEAGELLTAFQNELKAQREKFVSEVAFQQLQDDVSVLLSSL